MKDSLYKNSIIGDTFWCHVHNMDTFFYHVQLLMQSGHVEEDRLELALPNAFSSATARPAEMAFRKIALLSISASGGNSGNSLYGRRESKLITQLLEVPLNGRV